MSIAYKSLYLRVRRWKLDFYEWACCCIILLNGCLRLALIYQGWPTSNSDEGTVGLMALHIAYHGALPIFFYGQGYMGSLEAFVGAALFPIFGASVIALRVGVLLLFTLFLVVMYRLTALLYNKTLALITLILLSLGTPEIFFREIEALAGHPETPLFCACIVLFTTWLCLTTPISAQSTCDNRCGKRRLLFALWGLLVGAALWNDPLAWAYIVLSGLFLLLFCRAELRLKGIVLSVLPGFLLGIMPIIIYNLFSATVTNSTATLWGFLASSPQASVASSIVSRLAGAIIVSLPVATGANPLCPLQHAQAWPLTQLSGHTLSCTVVHADWGMGIIILWMYAFWQVIRLLPARWYQPLLEIATFGEQRERVLRVARVVMLAGAGLSFLIFALSPQSVTDPWANSRYLFPLAVAVPAMFWPLLVPEDAMKQATQWRNILKKGLIGSILLVFSATLVLGTLDTFALIPSAQGIDQQQEKLVSDLLRLHATRIYTDYWTCDLVAFLSHEQIICSVLDDNLQPGVNRYTPYVAEVKGARPVTYVFLANSTQAQLLDQRMKERPQQYQSMLVDGYMVYRVNTRRNT